MHSYSSQALQLIEDRAIHFHFTQSQVFISSRDDYVNIAAIHPHSVTRVTVEVLNGTSWDAWDHSTPGRRSRGYLVNPRRLPGRFTLDSSLGSVELQNVTTPKVILGKLSEMRFLLSMSGITEIFVHTHFLFGFWYFPLRGLIFLKVNMVHIYNLHFINPLLYNKFALISFWRCKCPYSSSL